MSCAPLVERREHLCSTLLNKLRRLVSPLAFSGVPPGSVAEATIETQEGRFELLPSTEMTDHYRQFLGTPIHGYFRVVGSGSVLNR